MDIKLAPLNVVPGNVVSDRSSEDEQLLMRSFYEKAKKAGTRRTVEI
jgi:hypothetical protein